MIVTIVLLIIGIVVLIGGLYFFIKENADLERMLLFCPYERWQ